MPKAQDELTDMLENFNEEELETIEEELDDSEVLDESDESVESDSADTEDELSETEQLKLQLAQRDQTIADMASKPADVKSDIEDSADDSTKGFQLENQAWEDTEFIGEDFDLNELTPGQFNTMLNKAAEAGAKIGAKNAAEQVLLSIPGIVKHNVNVQSSIQTAVKDFYSGNQDLLKFKGAVSSVTQELAAKNPDWPLTK